MCEGEEGMQEADLGNIIVFIDWKWRTIALHGVRCCEKVFVPFLVSFIFVYLSDWNVEVIKVNILQR